MAVGKAENKTWGCISKGNNVVKSVFIFPPCSFCKQENETMDHLFWHCPIVTTFFWADLLHVKCSHRECFPLKLDLILFGVDENVVTM